MGAYGKNETKAQREATHPSDVESASEQESAWEFESWLDFPNHPLPLSTLCRVGLTFAQHGFGNPEGAVCTLVGATHSRHQQSSHTPRRPHAGTLLCKGNSRS